MKKRCSLMIFLLIFIVIMSGCVSQSSESGLGIRVESSAQPQQIFAGSKTNVYVDVENMDTTKLDSVNIKIYDSGLLSSDDCQQLGVEDMFPRVIKTLQCLFTAPEREQLARPQTTTDVMYGVSFSKSISLPVAVDVVSEDEYRRLQLAGKIEYNPKIHTYSDSNIYMEAEFSEQPPIIAAYDKKMYLYIKIRNVGVGFIQPIEPEDFSIETVGETGIEPECDFGMTSSSTLNADKGIFPPITCTIEPGANKNYLSRLMIIIKYKYNYDVRGSIPITIIK